MTFESRVYWLTNSFSSSILSAFLSPVTWATCVICIVSVCAYLLMRLRNSRIDILVNKNKWKHEDAWCTWHIYKCTCTTGWRRKIICNLRHLMDLRHPVRDAQNTITHAYNSHLSLKHKIHNKRNRHTQALGDTWTIIYSNTQIQATIIQIQLLWCTNSSIHTN